MQAFCITLIISIINSMNIIGLFYVFIYQMYTFYYRNTLKNWIIEMVFKYYKDIHIIFTYLYDIKIDENNVNCFVMVLFNKKTLYYIHNLYYWIF